MLDDALRGLTARYGLSGLLSGRVLIVDDDPDNLEVVASFLDGDYEVLRAASGFEALRVASEVPLDVVVTDQRMPEMTGVELLERLRATHPDAAGILLTAYTDSPALVSAINQARAFRFLRKPWQAEDLVTAVAQASESVFHTRAVSRLVQLLAERTTALEDAVTDLRIAQAQMLHLERLGTMGRVAAGITHDLRNALQGMLMVESQLEARGVPLDARRALTLGLAGMRNLLGTVQTLNQFAQGSRLTVALEPTDPIHVAADTLTVMRLSLESRHRQVEDDFADDSPEISADRPKLVQVFVNLVQNAIQATPESAPVRFSVRRKDEGHVAFVVDDGGPGIDPGVLPRLFQPFTTTKGKAGMGMGLYMSKLIVAAHGGTITATNRPEGGARFEVVIPVAPVSR